MGCRPRSAATNAMAHQEGRTPPTHKRTAKTRHGPRGATTHTIPPTGRHHRTAVAAALQTEAPPSPPTPPQRAPSHRHHHDAEPAAAVFHMVSANPPPPQQLAEAAGGLSGDDASKKVRKPYTITKSRESWTEQEHDKFLEALQL